MADINSNQIKMVDYVLWTANNKLSDSRNWPVQCLGFDLTKPDLQMWSEILSRQLQHSNVSATIQLTTRPTYKVMVRFVYLDTSDANKNLLTNTKTKTFSQDQDWDFSWSIKCFNVFMSLTNWQFSSKHTYFSSRTRTRARIYFRTWGARKKALV